MKQQLIITFFICFCILGCSNSTKDKLAGKQQITPISTTKTAKPVTYKVRGRSYQILSSANNFQQQGNAVFYSKKLHGRRTASGEIFDIHKMTAAHTTLPMHSIVEVRNIKNNKTVEVRINDRGPFNDRFIIDLSPAAAKKIGITQPTPVNIRTLD